METCTLCNGPIDWRETGTTYLAYVQEHGTCRCHETVRKRFRVRDAESFGVALLARIRVRTG